MTTSTQTNSQLESTGDSSEPGEPLTDEERAWLEEHTPEAREAAAEWERQREGRP